MACLVVGDGIFKMNNFSEEFNKLINNIPKFTEEKKKQHFEECIRLVGYSEDGEIVVVHLWERDYIFDRKSYVMFEELWNKGILKQNKDGYLCIKDKDYNDEVNVHRWLKRKEVEELAIKLKCDEGDIHVHHKNIKNPYNKQDNRFENLEVLHKDYHAQRHGFLTWEEFQEWRKNNIKK